MLRSSGNRPLGSQKHSLDLSTRMDSISIACSLPLTTHLLIYVCFLQAKLGIFQVTMKLRDRFFQISNSFQILRMS